MKNKSLKLLSLIIATIFAIQLTQAVFIAQPLPSDYESKSLIEKTAENVNNGFLPENESGEGGVRLIASGSCGTQADWEFTSDAKLTVSGSGAIADYVAGEAPWYQYRDSIKEIDVGSEISAIGDYAFYGCYNVESVTIPLGTEANPFFQIEAIPPVLESIGNGAFSGCMRLVSIKIPSSVKSIGQSAFSDCFYLEEISLKGNVLESIGDRAFFNCKFLESISLPISVKTIGDYVFSGCLLLNSISVVTDNLYFTAVDGVLFNKYKTKLIRFPSYSDITDYEIPNTVESIEEEAFADCTTLKSVVIPSSVDSIGGNAFVGCNKLENIYFYGNTPIIPSDDGNGQILGNRDKTVLNYLEGKSGWTDDGSGKWNGYTIRKFAGGICGENSKWSFDGESSLTVFGTGTIYDDIIPWNEIKGQIETIIIKEGITGIGADSFNGCNKLTYVSIPSTVTSISDEAFAQCTSLENIVISSSVSSIGEKAFVGCSALKSVQILYSDSSTNISIGDKAFSSCPLLESVFFCGNAPSMPENDSEYPAFGSKDNTKIYYLDGTTGWTIDNGKWNGYSVQTFTGGLCGKNAVWNLDSDGVLTVSGNGPMNSYGLPDSSPWGEYRTSEIKSIVINQGIISIGTNSFKDCESVESVTIASSVNVIGEESFAYCESLKTLTFAQDSSLQKIELEAFQNCPKLESIVIPASVKTIEDEIFFGCKSLKTVAFEENSNLRMFGSFFSGNEWITSVIIPDSVLNIYDDAFSGCSSLISVTIPASVIKIGFIPFVFCTELESIIVDENNEFYSSENGVLYNKNKTELIAFPNGSDYSDYEIPDSVKYIYKTAFAYNNTLENVIIPASVKSIGTGAFMGCNKLKNVFFCGNAPTLSELEEEAYTFCHMDGSIDESTDLSVDDITLYYLEGKTGWETNAVTGKWNCYTVDTFDLQGLSVTKQPTKTNYWAGETFDPAGMTVTAIFGINGGNKEVDVLNYSVLLETALSKNDNIIKVSYTVGEVTKTANVEITVQELTLLSIEITTPPTKTEYFSGDIFDPTGMVVTAMYPYDMTAIVTDYTFTPDTALTKDDSIVTVSYTVGDITKTANVAVTVTDARIVSIEIIGQPTKTEYISGEIFDTSGMSAKLNYENGKFETKTDLSISPKGKLTADDIFAVVYYTADEITKTETVPITVTEASSETIASGDCGNGVFWSLNNEFVLSITGSGAINDYTSGTSPWSSYNTSINTIEIGDDITTIGDYAFYGCTALSFADIPAKVVNIGTNAFGNCTNLKSVFMFGNAPTVESEAFISDNVSIFYIEDKTGFDSNGWTDYKCSQFSDLNKDGKINVLDAIAMKKIISEFISRYDFERDGVIDNNDIAYVFDLILN